MSQKNYGCGHYLCQEIDGRRSQVWRDGIGMVQETWLPEQCMMYDVWLVRWMLLALGLVESGSKV